VVALATTYRLSHASPSTENSFKVLRVTQCHAEVPVVSQLAGAKISFQWFVMILVAPLLVVVHSVLQTHVSLLEHVACLMIQTSIRMVDV
jgi:hypothetical protein